MSIIQQLREQQKINAQIAKNEPAAKTAIAPKHKPDTVVHSAAKASHQDTAGTHSSDDKPKTARKTAAKSTSKKA